MYAHYLLIPKSKKTRVFLLGTAILLASIFLFNSSFLKVRAETPLLLDKTLFRESEQSTVIVHPRFHDGSSNIIFYIDYGDNNLTYVAETIGHADLPFSDYYAPPPGIGKYLVIEYNNNGGQFGCNGISPMQCIADPHFISQVSFEIVSNDAIIPNPAVANPVPLSTNLNEPTSPSPTIDSTSSNSASFTPSPSIASSSIDILVAPSPAASIASESSSTIDTTINPGLPNTGFPPLGRRL